MDCKKTGELISRLRKEKGLTQKALADRLNISNKTVSKWECGLGFPDSSLWQQLSEELGADLMHILDGELRLNKKDVGKLTRMSFYVCPDCNGIVFSTSSPSIYCCGKIIDKKASTWELEDKINLSDVDGELLVSIDHPMNKDGYILFVAMIKNERVSIFRMYPEQSCEVRIPKIKNSLLVAYSTKLGLSTLFNLK